MQPCKGGGQIVEHQGKGARSRGVDLADKHVIPARQAQARQNLRGRRPLRVVLDSALNTPPTAQVLSFAGSTLVLTRNARSPLAEPLREAGARVETIPASPEGLDLDAVLQHLGELECNEVLVEAGPTLAGEFVRLGLVDEIVVYMAPVVLGDVARSLFKLPPLARMCDRCEFEWRDVARVGDDLRLTVRPRRGVS